jgi:hypothetical protein
MTETHRASFRDLTVRVFDRSAHSPHKEESDLFDEVLLGWLAQERSAFSRAERHPSTFLVDGADHRAGRPPDARDEGQDGFRTTRRP